MKFVLWNVVILCALVVNGFAQEVPKDSMQIRQSTQASFQAQRTAWNTVHLEILGNGFIGSISYEGAIFKYLTLRAGAGYTPLGIIIPITLNGFIGEGEHLCEIGAGITLTPTDPRCCGKLDLIPALRLGYRYSPLHGGFNFGVAFTPLILPYTFQPWVGISLGWGF
jgi:hypothetical protein